MNRFFKAFSLIAALAFFAACKSDDDNKIDPPRDYGEQYTAEKPIIEEYLKTHYIVSVSEDMDINIQPILEGGTEESIWDQDVYPLQSKPVHSNGVDYTVYYLILNEGAGEAPTRADNVLVAYKGSLLDNSVFQQVQFPQNLSPLAETIPGWQEIIPLFKTGVYVDIPGSPDPPAFEDFGAGVMFLPSGLGYYNASPTGEGVTTAIPAYSSLIFSFKLYALEYLDNDNDGILSKDETIPGVDIAYYDTDGDGLPNYFDSDDDGDGFFTIDEITDPLTGDPYPFEDIPTCEGGTLKKHLDPACN